MKNTEIGSTSANINTKKQQFIHSVNSDGSKTAKNHEKVYYSSSHGHLGEVMIGNNTFLWFSLFFIH